MVICILPKGIFKKYVALMGRRGTQNSVRKRTGRGGLFKEHTHVDIISAAYYLRTILDT